MPSTPSDQMPTRHTQIPEVDGLFWYHENDTKAPEPVLINQSRYGKNLKGFNGRTQSWLKDGEYLIGPYNGPFEPMQDTKVIDLIHAIDRHESTVHGEILAASLSVKGEKRYACLVDGKDDPLFDCVWDGGNINDCSIACTGVKKCDCEHWQEI